MFGGTAVLANQVAENLSELCSVTANLQVMSLGYLAEQILQSVEMWPVFSGYKYEKR